MAKGPKSKRVPMPLFHVQVGKNGKQHEIYKITDFYGTAVQVEKFRGSQGPTQCFNCQGFFHSAIACHLAPRCVRCGGNHSSNSEQCKKDPSAECTCANCGGPHPANFRGCPKWPAEKKSVRRIKSQNKKPDVAPKTPVFKSKIAEPGLSFAAAATVKDSTPKASIKTSVPSSQGEDDTDFLKYLLTLEATYDRKIILAAFKAALPSIRAASHPMDRIFALYESLVLLAP